MELIVRNYSALSVLVTDLGNGAYRLADAALVDARECVGVRLPAGAAEFVEDVLAYGREAGLQVGLAWAYALAQACAEGARVFVVLG